MNSIILKLIATIMIAGELVRKSREPAGDDPGFLSLIEVSHQEGRDLLGRNKAVIPTEAELAAAGYEFDLVASGTEDTPLHPDIETHQADRAAQAADAAAAAADQAAQEAADSASASTADAGAADTAQDGQGAAQDEAAADAATDAAPADAAAPAAAQEAAAPAAAPANTGRNSRRSR